MTNSILPSDNNRLDRIEELVQNTTRNIDQLSQLQLRMMEESSEYRRNTLEMRADMLETRTDILEMQSEVRGLQAENRRILDRLLNEN